MDKPLDAARMSSQEIIARVKLYHETEHVWSLHCALFTSHPPLEAVEEDGKVVLVCPQEGCGHRQHDIPASVFSPAVDAMHSAQVFYRTGKEDGDG